MALPNLARPAWPPSRRWHCAPGSWACGCLGPNSIGVVDVHSGAILSVNAVLETDTLHAGGISVISQSGSMLGALLSRGAARGLGFAKLVSVGNEADIGVGELVDLMVDDSATEVILLFLETIRDAAVLGPALRRARAAGKPVLVYKLGRSAQGEALAQSHTGALAGNDAAVDAFLRKHGAMRVEMLETLFEAAPLARRYASAIPPLDRNPRIAVVTTTGGGAATVVDRLGLADVEAVAPPTALHRTHGRARPEDPPDADSRPDAGRLAGAVPRPRGADAQSDWCDAVLCVAGSSAQFHPAYAVRPIVEASAVQGKPLLAFLAPEAGQSLTLLQEAGVPAFRTPESCADALACLFRAARTPLDAGTPPEPVAWPAGLPTHGDLSEFEAAAAFGELGVPIAPMALVQPNALQHAGALPGGCQDLLARHPAQDRNRRRGGGRA